MKDSRFLSVLFLIILLAAWFTRWENVASKTYNDGVVKWKVDRWTGYAWIDVYTLRDIGGMSGPTCFERPASNNEEYFKEAIRQRDIATNVWRTLIAIDIAWIVASWIVLPATTESAWFPACPCCAPFSFNARNAWVARW